jgi:hypothetical protein
VCVVCVCVCVVCVCVCSVCVCVCVRSSEAAASTELYEHVALCLVLRASRFQISIRRLMCGATFEAVSAVLLVCDPSYQCFEGSQRLHLHGRTGQILHPEYEGSTHLRNAGNHSPSESGSQLDVLWFYSVSTANVGQCVGLAESLQMNCHDAHLDAA